MLRRSADPVRFHLPRRGSQRLGHARGEQGSALVETAMCLALLLTILFGIMEFSLVAYAYHFISHAAREGTRYAIVRGSACNSFGTACPASAADIRSYVRTLAYPGITGTVEVAPTWPTTNDPGRVIQVTVTYRYPLSLPFMPASTINMSSTSAMVISQ